MEHQSSFHGIISQLIERLYPKSSQKARRIVLHTYFTQSPHRRSLTLAELGNSDSLEKPLTRERARQFLSEFFAQHLPNEIAKVERGIALNDPIMLGSRGDIQYLRRVVKSIIEEVETFKFPIFARRMQDRLVRLGLVDDKIYFPVLIRLSESFQLRSSFKIDEYDGQVIVLDENQDVQHVTKDIITYAGKLATHLGGVCSFEALLTPEWDSKAPASISALDDEIKSKYILDLMGTVKDVMLLNDKTYFAFRNRDERVSTFLVPIFSVYKTLHKEKLFNAVITGLKHRFMTKPNSLKREMEIKTIIESLEALDEYCCRMTILDKRSHDSRVAGKLLTDKIANEEIGELAKSQINMARAIKESGGPVSSKDFGNLYRNVLQLKDSQKGHFYTYPTLFYKNGNGRKNDFYRTLDDLYEIADMEGKVTENTDTIDRIKERIARLQQQLEHLDDTSVTLAQHREEQGLLRAFLIETSDGMEMSSGDVSCKCMLCNRYYPSNLLVAAHVKKRSRCDDHEKKDIENIAMLQCCSCDRLFEEGYIYLNEHGVVQSNDNFPLTDDLENELVKLENNICEYMNGNENRSIYAAFHRDWALKKFMV